MMVIGMYQAIIIRKKYNNSNNIIYYKSKKILSRVKQYNYTNRKIR